MPSLMGITQSAFDPASRFRFIQFIPAFQEAGWSVSHRPNRPDRQWRSPWRQRLLRGVHYRAGRLVMQAHRVRDAWDARHFDAVFTNRDLAGGHVQYEQLLLRHNPRVVFDFDDAIYIGRGERVARWMCEHAAWVTPGNTQLAAWARQFSDRVTIIPTVIDVARYEPRRWSEHPPGRPIRVGWSGSDISLQVTLAPQLPLIARAQRDLEFELVIISNSRPDITTPGLRWSFRPWRADEDGLLGRFFDVGIMPLVDDDFHRGKCGLKLLQYMAAGLPTIGSPVGVNSEIIQHGITGFLAATEEEWRAALSSLMQDGERCVAMGTAGRERCMREYSLDRWFPELLAIVQRVADRHGP